MSQRVFKVLKTDGSAFHGGTGKWDLPKNGTPGKWKTVKGEIEPCENGLHLCYAKDLLTWVGPAVFEAEYEGELVNAGDKIVVRKARLVKQLNWDDRVARLFACDCAERALKRERKNGREPDPRSWAAVFVARKHANSQATDEELDAAWAAARAAAWDAARAAAGAAARDAAWDAAWAAAGAAARDAARAPARDAAWAAAWDAARAAARAAETRWQTKRLLEYLDGKRN